MMEQTGRQADNTAGRRTGRNAAHAMSIESQSTQQDELADDGADRQAGRQAESTAGRRTGRKAMHAVSIES
jgi:hypothetical protein